MGEVGSIVVAGGFMAALGVGLAALLAAAHRRLYVFEDPRIDQVEELLPRNNCGACGQPGCRVFAEGLVEGKLTPAECTVSAPETRQQMADLLGVEVGNQEKRVARLACAGGRHVAWMRAVYAGLPSCRAADLVSGGGKACAWGCLGLGDCEVVCTFDAIRLDAHGLPQVDPEKCTACGDCVDVCPKRLFSLEPVSHRLWIACRNRADGDSALASCEVACDACGRCVADAAPGLMRLEDNLAVIDYARNALAARAVIDRCPTGAIVWIEDGERAVKGPAARRVLRQSDLPLAAM